MYTWKCSFYCGNDRSVYMRDYIVSASTPFDASRTIESLFGADKYFRWSSAPNRA
jgi:hypothetical protein